MSIHILTPKDEGEVQAILKEARDGIAFTLENYNGLIAIGDTQINCKIEPTQPHLKWADGHRCKVNFYALKPAERNVTLQDLMETNAQVRKVIESIITALDPIRDTRQ